MFYVHMKFKLQIQYYYAHFLIRAACLLLTPSLLPARMHAPLSLLAAISLLLTGSVIWASWTCALETLCLADELISFSFQQSFAIGKRLLASSLLLWVPCCSSPRAITLWITSYSSRCMSSVIAWLHHLRPLSMLWFLMFILWQIIWSNNLQSLHTVI